MPVAGLEDKEDIDLLTLFRAIKIPEPELIKKLRDNDLELHSRDIENVAQWMIRIFKGFSEKK